MSSNRFLTGVENRAFGLQLSEYHTGYRAFRREVLDSVNFQMNSDGFIFDQEIMAQIVELSFASRKFRCRRATSRRHRRRPSRQSSRYGLDILWLLVRYQLHRFRIVRQKQFESLHAQVSRGGYAGRAEGPAREGGAESCRDLSRRCSHPFHLRRPADLAAVQSQATWINGRLSKARSSQMRDF